MSSRDPTHVLMLMWKTLPTNTLALFIPFSWMTETPLGLRVRTTYGRGTTLIARPLTSIRPRWHVHSHIQTKI